MCGFCGFTGNNFNDSNNTIINKMTDKIEHRGPDSAGFHIDEKISLGFRRLSFLGLTDGLQPMYNEDRSLVIVFNGEIYNFLPLRNKLIELGHVFSSHADTEVLLHLYEEYQENMLEHLRGMFAFVIYDLRKDEIFAARDFFGIKPFYYSLINNQLLFGSEIKSFLGYPLFEKEVNLKALEYYLTFQYSVLNETFFKNVFKLEPGHYLKFKDGKIDITKYFQISFDVDHNKTLDEFVQEIDTVVGDSIEHHKVSDVEIGSFLSSGVDSSMVAARFNWEKTFTVGFDYDSYSEIDYAKQLSEDVGLQNFSKIISTEEYWDSLGKIQYHMDEPLADPSAVALYFVSQMARQHVKGVLSGEGADELFGGYNIYKEPMDLKPLTSLPMPVRKTLAGIAKKMPNVKGKNFFIRGEQALEERFIGNAKIFTPDEVKRIFKNPTNVTPQDITKKLYQQVQGEDEVTKMQYIDLHLWLVGDILLKADKMSMAHCLEVRVPYLDKEVYRVARTIPEKYRVTKDETKYAFRLAAKRHLKEETAKKKKLGFPVPIRIWLKEEKYYNKVKSAFENSPANQFFHKEELVKLLDNHKQGNGDYSRRIWTLYMFFVWYDEFFSR